MTFRILSAPLLLGVVLASAGCASTRQARVEPNPADLPLLPGAYDGPECTAYQPAGEGIRTELRVEQGRRVFFTAASRRAQQPVEEQILRVICNHGVTGGAAPAYRQDHLAFEWADFDHLLAALMVAECQLFGDCAGDGSPAAAGMLSLYAERLALSGVSKGLRATSLSGEARSYFLEQVQRDVRDLQARAAALPEAEKALYVEAPRRAIAAKEEYLQRTADLFDRLDRIMEEVQQAAAAGKLDESFEERVVALQNEHLRRCKRLECASDTFFQAATRDLIYVRTLAGRRHAAAADFRALRFSPTGEPAANALSWAVAIHAAQVAAAHTPLAAEEPSAEAGLWDAADEIPDHLGDADLSVVTPTPPAKVKSITATRGGLSRLVLDPPGAAPYWLVPTREVAQVKPGEVVRLLLESAGPYDTDAQRLAHVVFVFRNPGKKDPSEWTSQPVLQVRAVRIPSP